MPAPAPTSVSDRLTRLETEREHLATKAELSEAKNHIMRWAIGVALAAGAIGAVLLNVFVEIVLSR